MSLECLVPMLLLLIMGLGYAGVVVWILGSGGESRALARGPRLGTGAATRRELTR